MLMITQPQSVPDDIYAAGTVKLSKRVFICTNVYKF